MAKSIIKARDAECVIFDLDGTLVDTAPDLLATLNALFTRRGHRTISLPEIRTTIGHGARAMIREGGQLTGTAFSEAQIAEMFQEYLALYGQNIANQSAVFPGGREVLDALAAAGVPMAICTNKLESLTHALLAALRIEHYFAAVIGADTLPTMKPDPAGVLKILEQTGARPARSLFVGDSDTDYATARAAGVPVVLVDFGYTLVSPRELAADRVISHLRELL